MGGRIGGRTLLATRGAARSGALGSAGIIEGAASHFSTRLDAEVGKVTRTFAVGAHYFATRAVLRSERCRGRLKALFFAMSYEVFVLVYGTEDCVRVKRRAGASCLNRRLQLGEEFSETIQEEY
jgi:hypothetical protein